MASRNREQRLTGIFFKDLCAINRGNVANVHKGSQGLGKHCRNQKSQDGRGTGNKGAHATWVLEKPFFFCYPTLQKWTLCNKHMRSRVEFQEGIGCFSPLTPTPPPVEL